MMIASKGAVWTAAVVLLASAVTGGYLGYSRAATTPGASGDTDAYDVTPLAAKQASPINNAPPIDEDYIRKIAHDEAETILHPPPKKVATAAASDDNSDDSSDDSSPGANPPTPPPTVATAAAAAAAKPPPPPPTGLY